MPIRICSKKEGYRRAGIAHPAEWVEHPDEAFSPEQIEVLQAEPMLQVEKVPEDLGKTSKDKRK